MILSFYLCHHLSAVLVFAYKSPGDTDLRLYWVFKGCLGSGPSTIQRYDWGTHCPSLNPRLLISEVKGQGWFISRVFFFFLLLFPFEISDFFFIYSLSSHKSFDADIIVKLHWVGIWDTPESIQDTGITGACGVVLRENHKYTWAKLRSRFKTTTY